MTAGEREGRGFMPVADNKNSYFYSYVVSVLWVFGVSLVSVFERCE